MEPALNPVSSQVVVQPAVGVTASAVGPVKRDRPFRRFPAGGADGPAAENAPWIAGPAGPCITLTTSPTPSRTGASRCPPRASDVPRPNAQEFYVALTSDRIRACYRIYLHLEQ